jgi:hypothetical protein
MQKIEVTFQGPFFFTSVAGPSIFMEPVGQEKGVYLWTIPFQKGGHIVVYVGETGVSFAKRLKEHMTFVMGGNYRLTDVEKMMHGKESVIWNGTWRKGTRDKMEEFLDHLPALAPKIQNYLRSICIFVAPTSVDTKTRRRIEGALAKSIRKSPVPYCSLYPQDNRYPVLKEGTSTFRLNIKLPVLIHGLKDELEA